MSDSIRAALQLVLTKNIGRRAQRLFRETAPSKYARQLPSWYSHNKNISFTGISTLYSARLEQRRRHGPGKSVRGEIDFGSKWKSFKSRPPLLRGIPPWVSIKPLKSLGPQISSVSLVRFTFASCSWSTSPQRCWALRQLLAGSKHNQ